MSEKVTLIFDNEMKEDVCKIMVGTQEIEVKRYIAYADREAMALEFASEMIVIDTEKEMAWKNVGRNVIDNYLMFKYYTNVDVTSYEDDKEKFYDLTKEIRDDIYNACSLDLLFTWNLCSEYLNMAIENYNKEHTIGHKLAMSLKGVITGEDIMKRLAESKIVNDEMINLIERAQKTDETASNVVFPGFAKKPD